MDMRNSVEVAPPGIRSLRSRTQKCRVCLKKTKEMVNIFDITPEQGVSIADLLSQSTGLEIFKGDPYPETVCTPCLQDAKSAFKIKQTQETRSPQVVHLLQQEPEEMSDLREEESGIEVKEEPIYNLSEESAPQIEYFQIDEFFSDEVKYEPMEENVSNEEPTKEYVHGQVINEPIEDDSSEEDVGESSDYEIDPSYLRKQSAGTNDKNDGNRPTSLTQNEGRNSYASQCSTCHKLFPTKTKLKVHEAVHNRPTYKCSHCYKAFIYQSVLQQHIRTSHTGEKPFKCSQCQKEFTSKQAYTVHFKSHPKIPLFKCSLCGLLYKSLKELEEHITTHPKPKPIFLPVVD